LTAEAQRTQRNTEEWRREGFIIFVRIVIFEQRASKIGLKYTYNVSNYTLAAVSRSVYV
jgi:hypothetical protein